MILQWLRGMRKTVGQRAVTPKLLTGPTTAPQPRPRMKIFLAQDRRESRRVWVPSNSQIQIK